MRFRKSLKRVGKILKRNENHENGNNQLVENNQQLMDEKLALKSNLEKLEKVKEELEKQNLKPNGNPQLAKTDMKKVQYKFKKEIQEK